MDDPEVERFLASLERDELIARLLAVSRRHDDVRFGLETEARAARGSFDLREAKKQLTAQVAIRGEFLPPRAARAYAYEVDGAVDTLVALHLARTWCGRVPTRRGRRAASCAARRRIPS